MEQLGINPVVIGIQILNFVVLLYILKRLLYRPILDVLEKRQQSIAETEKIRTELVSERELLQKEKADALKETRKQAEQMLLEARQRGDQLVLQLQQDAQKQTEDLIAQGKRDLKLREEESWQRMRKEIKQVAIEVAEQVLENELTPEQQKMLANESVRRLKEHGA